MDPDTKELADPHPDPNPRWPKLYPKKLKKLSVELEASSGAFMPFVGVL
jgi:hypothetical protein